MKKLLVIILTIATYFSSYAQDQQLFENDWFLRKIVINEQDIFPPNISNEQINGTIQFLNSTDIVSINYCDFTDSIVEYDLVSNEFSLQDFPSVLLGDCLYPTNLSFGSDYFSIFFDSQHFANNPFQYTIENNNSVLTLTIVNSTGDYAVYNNIQLSYQDMDYSFFKVYPNPVSNTLYATPNSFLTNASFEFYTVVGKKVLSINKTQITNNAIDVSTLAKGVYFLRILNSENKTIATKKISKK